EGEERARDPGTHRGNLIPRSDEKEGSRGVTPGAFGDASCFLLQHLHRGLGLRLRLSHLAGLARGLGLTDQLRGVAAMRRLNSLTGRLTATRGLNILAARSLRILTSRGLNILTARRLDILLTTRGLNILTTRGLDILTTRGLNILTTWSLDILTASTGQRSRRLNVLASRSLLVLTSAGERARRLNILSLGDLAEHLLRLLDLGAARLSVHRRRQGTEHCHAHDDCEKSFHLSPVPFTLLRCGAALFTVIPSEPAGFNP